MTSEFIRIEVEDPAKETQVLELPRDISLSLMELHGGTLTLRSTPGQGTTADARFPAQRVVREPAASVKT